MQLPRAGTPLEGWAEWRTAEDEETGALDSYLSMLHRCLIICPSILLAPFTVSLPSNESEGSPIRNASASTVSINTFELLKYQIFDILRYCTEKGTLRSAMQLLQLLFTAPSTIRGINSMSSEWSDVIAARGTLVQLSIDNLANGVLEYIFYLIGVGIPTMLWATIVETLNTVILACSESADGNAGSAVNSTKCRHWLTTILSNPGIIPTVPAQYRGIVLEVLISYPVYEKRRFRIFMQDLNKVCNSEMSVEALLDYTVDINTV